MDSHTFAYSFCNIFNSLTSHLRPLEIPLFRALRATLISLSKIFFIEEYHGSKYQVTFSGSGPYSRRNARCELADLFFVVFDPRKQSIRITFFQAKSERRIINDQCVSGEPFNANLEQWDLLANRPIISGVGSFDPPPNLLSKAILPSIGTFGIFYRHRFSRNYQIFYSVADNLTLYSLKYRYGKLVPKICGGVRQIKGHLESIASCSTYRFAYYLFDHKIGTPIHQTAEIGLPGVNNRIIRGWLANILRHVIQDAGENRTDLAQELLGILEQNFEEYGKSGGFGAKSLFLIKTTPRGQQVAAADRQSATLLGGS